VRLRADCSRGFGRGGVLRQLRRSRPRRRAPNRLRRCDSREEHQPANSDRASHAIGDAHGGCSARATGCTPAVGA
jgi:hypothetical protein